MNIICGLPKTLALDLIVYMGLVFIFTLTENAMSLFFWYFKVENLGNVHHQFQKLLTELKKPTDAYELNIANKLYGEKNFQFLQVSFMWSNTSLIRILGPMASNDQMGETEAGEPGWLTCRAFTQGTRLSCLHDTKWSVLDPDNPPISSVSLGITP